VREEEPHAPLRRHDPDYMVSNFMTTTYNRDGVAEAMMSAARMVHYPTTTRPSCWLARSADQARRGAHHGKAPSTGIVARRRGGVLYDNVVLVREAMAEAPKRD